MSNERLRNKDQPRSHACPLRQCHSHDPGSLEKWPIPEQTARMWSDQGHAEGLGDQGEEVSSSPRWGNVSINTAYKGNELKRIDYVQILGFKMTQGDIAGGWQKTNSLF